ncbi:DUF454 family protein [Comamonadaceae bacterium OH3737_COT-264]|nr:DUF454 family protein [Comamonadaceae bacterium OH3737_COT-264]
MTAVPPQAPKTPRATPPEPAQAPATAHTPARKPRALPHTNPVMRTLLHLLALLCLALGIVGVFVPGLPTTVFILTAAWAAARSSPRTHDWLLGHKTFGPTLRNWEEGGLVSRKSKYTASLVMAASVGVMLLTNMPKPAIAFTAVCLACVAIWLWLRPEPPSDAM